MFRIDSRFINANIARTIRCTENLFEQLSQIAFDNNMSFNAVVLQCCKYALDHYEKDNP